MNYLGVDYGRKRVGLSIYHDSVGIVLPLTAILGESDSVKIDKISEIVTFEKISHIVVGFPINMDGTIGKKAKEVDAFIKKLEGCLGSSVKIFRMDERLTSEDAANKCMMFYNRQSPSKKMKNRRSGVVDSHAAMIILQDFINENGNLLNQ